jgi:hypothetical protein
VQHRQQLDRHPGMLSEPAASALTYLAIPPGIAPRRSTRRGTG